MDPNEIIIVLTEHEELIGVLRQVVFHLRFIGIAVLIGATMRMMFNK